MGGGAPEGWGGGGMSNGMRAGDSSGSMSNAGGYMWEEEEGTRDSACTCPQSFMLAKDLEGHDLRRHTCPPQPSMALMMEACACA